MRLKMSLNKEYWRIWNFMQWFVKEQTEEEILAMPVLMKMRRWRASPV
jgi:ferritin